MATDNIPTTFFTLPREVRDLIYAYLIPKANTYALTSARVIAPYLGLINTTKVVQYEMLEALCPNDTLRLYYAPGRDRSIVCTDPEMLARMTHLEIYVDFGRFRWWRCGLGWQDAEIRGVSDQVGELLRMWNEQSTTERESCRIVIEDNNNWVSPILRLSFLDAVRRLVGLRSLVVKVLTNKPDLRKLGTCLASSLGPSTVHCEWPVLGPLDRQYGSVMFQPREFLAGRQR